MANYETEMLHEMVANLNRFMENQTRIINSLVCQVKDLQNRVASCEMSRGDNVKAPLEVPINEDMPEKQPRSCNKLPLADGEASLVNFEKGAVRLLGGNKAPPTHQPFTSRRPEEPLRPMPRQSDVCEDRRASMRRSHPVPLPRITSLSKLTEPCQCPTFTAPPGASAKVRVSPQKAPRFIPSSRRSSNSPRSATLRQPLFSGSKLSPCSPASICPPPSSKRRQQGRSSPRRKGHSSGRTQRITERGVRGHIRFFIAERNFGFVTRTDDGENVFLHRNEIVNIPRDAALNLQEGDRIEFDVMWTDRTPAARNVKLLTIGLEAQQRSFIAR